MIAGNQPSWRRNQKKLWQVWWPQLWGPVVVTCIQLLHTAPFANCGHQQQARMLTSNHCNRKSSNKMNSSLSRIERGQCSYRRRRRRRRRCSRGGGEQTPLCCSSSPCCCPRWHNHNYTIILPSSSTRSAAPLLFLLTTTLWFYLLASQATTAVVATDAADAMFSSSSSSSPSDNNHIYRGGGGGGGGSGEDEHGGGGLYWQDLVISTSPPSSATSRCSTCTKNTQTQIIVHECSGYIPNGHVCGILGPSGSGKTSFLTALQAGTGSGSISTGGSSSMLYVHGNVCLYHHHHQDEEQGNAPSNSDRLLLSSISKHDVAYLQQEDTFFTMLTVQETLQLAAFLELPHLSQQQRQARVQEQLTTLGLTHVAHRRVGSSSSSSSSTTPAALRHNLDDNDHDDDPTTSTTRISRTAASGEGGGRLSGGERRRLSVALELLTHDKKLLLADECTSGLDSRMARHVMSLLQRMARLNNIPAICSLHQPQSYIYWNLLDDVIVMAPGGHVVYSGPGRQDCLDYFARHAKATTHGPYTCPQGTNPAEFLVDLVSIDTEDAEQAERDLQRIQELAHCFAQYQKQHRPSSPLFAVQTQQSTNADDDEDDDNEEQSCAAKRISRKQSQVLQRSPPLALPRSIAPLVRHVGRVSRRWLALLRRSWRQNVRNHKANLFRFCSSAGTAILLSMVFYPTIGGGIVAAAAASSTTTATTTTTTTTLLPTANSVADRVALLTFGAINIFFMSFLKTITLISEEQPVVQREQTRQQYSSLEYLMAKVVAELPLDALFATVFTTALKLCSGVRISWQLLTATFSLLTVSGASLGFMLGSWLQGSRELSMASASPVVVVLMVVGVINPGGVDAKSPPPPALIRWLKRCSPFVYAVEALCLGEYPGMQLRGPRDGLWGRLKDLPKMGAFAMVQNGDQVIEALGLKGKTYHGVMGNLGQLSIYYLVLSWVGLQVMGHHSNLSATRVAESCHSKGNDSKTNTPPTNEDVLAPRNKDSHNAMSALKVPPRGW